MATTTLPNDSNPSRGATELPGPATGVPRMLRTICEFMCAAPISLAVTVAAVGLYLLPAFAAAFEFSTQESYTPVRILGCHLLHWSGEHLFWDVAMFAAFGYLCETQSRFRFVAVLLTSAVAIPVMVAFTNPEIQSYRGLSGLDTALFALFTTSLAIAGWRRRDRFLLLVGACGMGLMCGKTVYEIALDASLFVSDLNFTPLPYSHLVGIVVGGAGAAFEVMYSTRRSAYLGGE